jgi:hypothetical protein
MTPPASKLSDATLDSHRGRPDPVPGDLLHCSPPQPLSWVSLVPRHPDARLQALTNAIRMSAMNTVDSRNDMDARLERLNALWDEFIRTPESPRHRALMEQIHAESAAYSTVTDAVRREDPQD